MDQTNVHLPLSEKLRHTGSLEQLFHVRRLILAEGPGAGMRLIEVVTEVGLRAVFLESRALDLYELQYRGVNLAFQSKNGLQSGRVQPSDNDFFRTWPGGMLATCGLRNTGPSNVDAGTFHPPHGLIGGMAAEQTSIALDWERPSLVISGRVQESALFGQRLVLDRRIEMPLDGSSITWRDVVSNWTPEPEPLFLLYHFNFGYPFLSPKLQLHVPPGTVLPRNETAQGGLATFDQFSEPQDGYEEQVFFHLPLAGNPQQAAVRLVNTNLGIRVALTYDTTELPVLVEWKSMRATDYALGIEPSTSRIRGRAAELADGYREIVPGFGSRTFNLRLEVAASG